MSRADNWDVPTVDIVWMQQAERDIKALAGELHDIGLDDLGEVALKVSGIRAICDEWLKLANRRADEQSERMEEPYDSGFVESFNRGQR